ncbi:asparagine synthase (glutamine-hydrolyzing) [Salinactinospora qingdaonensis]|uniref:asparagine synthase (glutamine-hydrolyzing) n=1 Tax=Salinactinospora qingdaonensis TaxID=702744 RepID=A0ABP7G1S8_9ACTN
MSGLVGWIDLQRDLSRHGDVVHAMTERMRNRGPDGKGTWLSPHAALGHRELATSGVPAHEQPLCVETNAGPVTATHIGRFDNADELRRDIESAGGIVRNGTDTELLLHAFLLWGTDLLDRVHGGFAFAIWDGRTRQLFLARDRLGVKPLYYFAYPGGLLFGSEPKAIMANPHFEARLDLHALPIVLQPRLAMPGETPLAGLHEVPPAHVLTYSQAGLSHRRYWELTSHPHPHSFEKTARHVRELLEEIIGRQLSTAAPMGAMLSGGIDSTSVAALAMQALGHRAPDSDLATYCVRFENDAEPFVATELRPDVDAPYASAAAEFLGTRHTTLSATTHDLLEVIPETRRARDLPGWGQFDASMYLLFQRMRRDCTVALTGEAADEVFGGYPYFFKPEVLQRNRFPWLGDGPKLVDFLSPELTALVKPEEDERERYAQLLARVPRLPGEDAENARMREVFFLGLAGPLSVILDRKERMSMALGLDVRVPFCDHRLLEYVWNVPWQLKCTGGVKGLLKAAMADVLPQATLQRKKSAYPHVQHSEYDRMLIRQASWIVNDSQSRLAWMFDTERFNELIRRISANELNSELPGGSNQAGLLIQLVEMHNWVDEYQVSVR